MKLGDVVDPDPLLIGQGDAHHDCCNQPGVLEQRLGSYKAGDDHHQRRGDLVAAGKVPRGENGHEQERSRDTGDDSGAKRTDHFEHLEDRLTASLCDRTEDHDGDDRPYGINQYPFPFQDRTHLGFRRDEVEDRQDHGRSGDNQDRSDQHRDLQRNIEQHLYGERSEQPCDHDSEGQQTDYGRADPFTQFLPLQPEGTFEQDDADGDLHHRGESISQQCGGVDDVGERDTGEHPYDKQRDDRWDTDQRAEEPGENRKYYYERKAEQNLIHRRINPSLCPAGKPGQTLSGRWSVRDWRRSPQPR